MNSLMVFLYNSERLFFLFFITKTKIWDCEMDTEWSFAIKKFIRWKVCV